MCLFVSVPPLGPQCSNWIDVEGVSDATSRQEGIIFIQFERSVDMLKSSNINKRDQNITCHVSRVAEESGNIITNLIG